MGILIMCTLLQLLQGCHYGVHKVSFAATCVTWHPSEWRRTWTSEERTGLHAMWENHLCVISWGILPYMGSHAFQHKLDHEARVCCLPQIITPLNPATRDQESLDDWMKKLPSLGRLGQVGDIDVDDSAGCGRHCGTSSEIYLAEVYFACQSPCSPRSVGQATFSWHVRFVAWLRRV